MRLTLKQKQSLRESAGRIADRIEEMLCDETIAALNQAGIEFSGSEESEPGEDFLRGQIAKLIL